MTVVEKLEEVLVLLLITNVDVGNPFVMPMCMFLFFNTIYYDDLIHTATILRVPSLSIVNGKCVSKCVCLCVFKCICSLSVQYILHNIDDHSERERERDTQLTD